MPNPFPKHEPYDRWFARLALLPEETDPSRRDAERSVAENQRVAERVALGREPRASDAVPSVQTGKVA